MFYVAPDPPVFNAVTLKLGSDSMAVPAGTKRATKDHMLLRLGKREENDKSEKKIRVWKN